MKQLLKKVKQWNDLKVVHESEGVVLVKKKCKSCGCNLRYTEVIDGWEFCEDCK